MSYIIKQYVKDADETLFDAANTVNTKFLSLIGRPSEVARYTSTGDSSVSGAGAKTFYDECVKINLEKGIHYYFHGKIKRLNSAQVFNIKLINYNGGKEQFLKKISVGEGELDSWVDVEFIFTPAGEFDTILFELERNQDDYSGTTQRYAHIMYLELSVINNEVLEGNVAVKLGVQSKSGLLMCINGQEIRIGRTGIYELRNGVVKASQFSVACAATERDETIYNTIKNTLTAAAGSETEMTSATFFGTGKYRTITPFVLDYMYEKED